MLCCSGLAAATEEPAEANTERAQKPVPPPTVFVTRHSGEFNGRKMAYTVTAGETYLRDKDDQPKAAIFAFTYTRDGDGSAARPVTFVWNGGPGSASLWLHMGTLGPKRISVPDDASHPGAPPYPILDAPETILDVTDLVFVDPVGTGFSRVLGEHENKEFWGLTEDAGAMAEFIRDWVTANNRWNAPKFLLGESFGTTRAAAVARVLQDRMDMDLNGLVLISQALDYAGSTPWVRHNIVSNITYLPTMAATALYHGMIDPPPADRQAFLDAARAFAMDELLPGLFRGNRLGDAERAQIRDRLAYFTGLSPDYIERADLRIDGFRFAKELLREQGLALGRLDARYTRDDIDDLRADAESDAASDAISPAFKAAVMQYMRKDLEITWERSYAAPADQALYDTWRWRPVPDDKQWEPMPVNTAPDLSAAMRHNPSLRVMVASGYYDLVTPFFDAEYTLDRHDIRPGRVDYHYYEGGHMMYVHDPSRLDLLEDIRAFIGAQSGN
jgi:carboxypeptidase C (cathepsin A)